MLNEDKNIRKKTDIGWAKMRLELERSMPAPDRRPKPVFWWFLTAGAIAFFVGSAATWLLYGGEKESAVAKKTNIEQASEKFNNSTQVADNQAVTTKTTNEIAPPEAPNSAQNLPNRPEKKAAFSTLEKRASADFDASKTGEKSSAKKAEKGSKKAAALEVFSTKTGTFFPTKKDETAPVFSAHNPAEPTFFSLQKMAEKGQPSQHFLVENGLADAPFLPPLLAELGPKLAEFSALKKKEIARPSPLFEPTKKLASPVIPVKNQSKKPFRFGLVGSVQAVGRAQFGGFSIGLAAEKKLSKRLAAEVDLTWNHLKTPSEPAFQSRQAAEFDQTDYLNQTQDTALIYAEPGKTIYDLPAPNATPSISQFLNVSAAANDRADLAVALRFRVLPRWQIGAGAVFSTLLRAKAARSSGYGAVVSPNAADLEGSFADEKSVNSLLSKALPRFDALVSGSVGYDFSKKWRLALAHHRGFLEQSALDGTSRKNRFWRLSATRWF